VPLLMTLLPDEGDYVRLCHGPRMASRSAPALVHIADPECRDSAHCLYGAKHRQRHDKLREIPRHLMEFMLTSIGWWVRKGDPIGITLAIRQNSTRTSCSASRRCDGGE
jgi:hypothetical protein